MSHKIAIVTDSTNDLPVEFREKYQIYVVPLSIVWGENIYLDGVELKAEDFYARLSSDSEIPTTSQPTPKEFLDKYQQAFQDGAEEIVAITISSAMSGTIGSARTAAQGFKIAVQVFDSKANSMGLGWQVLAAARARELGGDSKQMIDAANQVRMNLHYHIILEGIDYLVRGGRIAGAARYIGGLLHLKPQIRVNHESGSVEAGGISRTRTQAIEGLYSSFFKQVDTSKPLHIAVLHNAAVEEAELLAQRVKQEFAPKELIISIVSPVLGVHTGPKALAICGYAES
ncbi:MAG: DegV family protein [Anaerolineaceae bacterium]